MKVELYVVKVKESSKELYFPSSSCEGIGYIWQKDDEHIWFRFIRQGSVSYVSSPCRYCYEDIDYKPLDKTITMF